MTSFILTYNFELSWCVSIVQGLECNFGLYKLCDGSRVFSCLICFSHSHTVFSQRVLVFWFSS